LSQQLEGNLFSSVCNLTDAFSGIERRKFLGQPSLAANGNLFVLVTREGRIALHLKELDIDDRLNVPKASCLWKAGGHLMINWIPAFGRNLFYFIENSL